MPPKEVGMRLSLTISAGLIAALAIWQPAATAQQQPAATASQTPAAQPQAQKMASDDVMALLERGEVFFLDVREPKEIEELGTLEGYVNIPLGEIEARLSEIPRDKAIITA
jgi:hypothetical protein